jgi:nucleoside-diphosphate-sugar epimerase
MIDSGTKDPLDADKDPNHGVQTVLVLGGAGYVGSVTIGKLLDRGYHVRVMDALMYGGESLGSYAGREGYTFIDGDLRNVEDVVRASAGADAVVHLGAVVGDPACAHDEGLARAVNLDATRTVAGVARGLGIRRLIFASSCGVYGASDDLLDEESMVEPVSLYSATKLGSEDVLLSTHSPGFFPTVLRFGTFFGASPRPRFDLVAHALVAKAVAEGEISIFGGDQWRPFLHVADGADAIIACLEAPEDVVGYRVYNVGSDSENHRLVDLGAMVVEAVPGTHMNVGPPASVEANYRVSFRRIREEVGFVAQHSLMDGIIEIRDELKRGGIGDTNDPRYSNIKALQLQDAVTVIPEANGSLQLAGGAA